MSTDKFKQVIPYTGIPVICAALIVFRIGEIDAFNLLQYEILIVFGYIATVGDIKTKRIPNSIILAMFVGWIIMLIPQLFVSTGDAIDILKDSLFGMALGGGLFLCIYLISRKGLGGGDVKFMTAAGLYLGFNGVLPTMLYGSILAALTGITFLLLKKIGRKDSMPLVPFLYAGILITVLFQ